MHTIESHGRTYRVFDGTYYDAGTPDEVIAVLDRARQSGQRIRIHHGYSTQADADAAGLGGVAGRDWLEEWGVTGTVGRSMGPIKIPILLAGTRSTGGGGILSACIVKITSGGRVLYKHENYHVQGAVEVRAIDETYGEGKHQRHYGAEVRVAGENHARFSDVPAARRWIRKMGLTANLHTNGA